jgi:CRISPR-associated protein Cas5
MLSILEKAPNLDQKVILEIEPLAPLSMVSDLPGSYYKTLKSPSKKMLCGLFENILEWHIDTEDRKEIIKEVKKIRKKQKLEFPEVTGSTYTPMLMEYFEIQLAFIPPITNHYDDLWTRAFRRTDSYRHTNNARFMDASFSEKWRTIKGNVNADKKRNSTQKNALLDKLFKRYMFRFPMYYGTPTPREYIFLEDSYKIKISIDKTLYDLLQSKLSEVNIGYLGSNEGWVNVILKNVKS